MSAHLDHSGLVVADLDGAARQMRALGFNLLPRSLHTVPNADGTLRLAGTANYCAMLQRGYLEIIAVTDPDADSFSRSEIGAFAERFEGLHLLAIGTDNADATRTRINNRQELAVSVRALHRKIDTPLGQRDAGFRLVVVPQLSGPDMTFFFIEHRTRELLWTPESMIHPNLATALLELVVITDDIESARKGYDGAFATAAVAGAGTLSYDLEASRFLVMTSDAAARHYEATLPLHALPHCAGQTVEVADLSVTASLLAANGVPFARTGDRLTIAPLHACGAFLQFAAAGR